MMSRLSGMIAAAVLASAQTPLKRVPPPEKYPFDQLVTALQEGEAPAPRPSPVIGPAPSSDVPPGYKPTQDVKLPETAKHALGVSQPWMVEKHAPAPGKDGRVLYTFGAGLPTIVCAPLRVCVLEMEPGERMTGEPHIGDSVRWMIAPASSGRPESATSMIVIKPQMAGLDTNLLVTTDRRAYYVRLISKSEEYIARVAFAYPELDAQRWKAHQLREQQRKDELEASRVAPLDSIENLYFDYRVVGGDENMRPVRVMDDGRKTFIQMTPNAATREAPVLVVLGADGPELVNYRVKGDLYIVDRLFERGALILGAGKKARRAEVIRGTYRGKPPKGDPYAKFTRAPEEKKR